MDIITRGKPTTDLSEEITERVKEVLYEYDKLPLTTALGILDVVKYDLIRDVE